MGHPSTGKSISRISGISNLGNEGEAHWMCVAAGVDGGVEKVRLLRVKRPVRRLQQRLHKTQMCNCELILIHFKLSSRFMHLVQQ